MYPGSLFADTGMSVGLKDAPTQWLELELATPVIPNGFNLLCALAYALLMASVGVQWGHLDSWRIDDLLLGMKCIDW